MKCFNCGVYRGNKYPLCDSCAPLVIDFSISCAVCGYPQSAYVKLCSKCTNSSELRNYSFYLYSGLAKDILVLYKFKKNYSFASFYGDLICRYIVEEYINPVVCPVPTSFLKRRLKSGYQLDPIVSYLKKQGLVVKWLLAKKYSATQKKLSRSLREQNLLHSFKVRSCKYKDRFIVLIDDVYTTGATLRSCYLALKEAGYKDIVSLTLYHD